MKQQRAQESLFAFTDNPAPRRILRMLAIRITGSQLRAGRALVPQLKT